MGDRIGEWTDDVHELDYRAWVPVADDQWESIRFRGSDVQEVDSLPVDLRGELRKPVELRFLLAPVEAIGPVLGEVLEVIERDAPTPADARYLVREAGASQTLSQVAEGGLGDLDPEGPDLSGCLVVRVGYAICHCGQLLSSVEVKI